MSKIEVWIGLHSNSVLLAGSFTCVREKFRLDLKWAISNLTLRFQSGWFLCANLRDEAERERDRREGISHVVHVQKITTLNPEIYRGSEPWRIVGTGWGEIIYISILLPGLSWRKTLTSSFCSSCASRKVMGLWFRILTKEWILWILASLGDPACVCCVTGPKGPLSEPAQIHDVPRGLACSGHYEVFGVSKYNNYT